MNAPPRIAASRGSALALLPTGGRTLAQELEQWAERTPDAVFVVFENPAGNAFEVSYAEMALRARRTARLLEELGVRRGDRLGVHLENSIEFLEALFGGAAIGAIAVPTNPLATREELAYVLEHAGCVAEITQADLLDTVLAAGRSAPALRNVLVVGGGEALPEGCHDFAERRSEVPGEPRNLESVESLDPATVLYTSGTTGRPKGVTVTHTNYLFAGRVVAEQLRMRPDDRWLVVLPLFHGNAQYYCTMSALVTGASIAVMPRFSASRWSVQAKRHRATLGSLFAAPVRMILAQPPNDTGNLRLRVTLFAQNLTDEELREFERRFSCPLLQLYGMTETVVPPLMNSVYGERRNMTLGRVVPCSSIRIVDESGDDAAPDEAGELWVHGRPGIDMMAGYFRDDVATKEAVAHGWLRTGDRVRVEAGGFVAFVDRAKDMIKRAGENVAAAEVEGVLNQHPAVFESAVVGVPDPLRDEAVLAFVVPKGAPPTAEELITWCRDRLSKFKVPSFVELVGELPRTSVGKIQRHVLREQARTSPAAVAFRGDSIEEA